MPLFPKLSVNRSSRTDYFTRGKQKYCRPRIPRRKICESVENIFAWRALMGLEAWLHFQIRNLRHKAHIINKIYLVHMYYNGFVFVLVWCPCIAIS